MSDEDFEAAEAEQEEGQHQQSVTFAKKSEGDDESTANEFGAQSDERLQPYKTARKHFDRQMARDEELKNESEDEPAFSKHDAEPAEKKDESEDEGWKSEEENDEEQQPES